MTFSRKEKVWAAILLVTHLVSCTRSRVILGSQDDMKDALDDMSYFFDGKDVPFNQQFYDQLVKCMHKDGDQILWASQQAAWRGIYHYWQTNATNKDYHGNPDYWGGHTPSWAEFFDRPNVTIGRYGILTYEPCNYASNVAYYHAVTKICKFDWSTSPEMQDGLRQAFAALAVGSHFYHQSSTSVGGDFDVNMINVVAYLGHQIMVLGLPNQTAQIKDLQPHWRSITAPKWIENFTNTVRTQPVPEWDKAINEGDYPKGMFVIFGAIVSNFVAFMLPGQIAQPLVELIAKYFLPSSTPPSDRKWLLEQYLPAIVEATKGNRIPLLERVKLLHKMIGVIIKMVYAFIFQEEFIPFAFLKTHTAIEIGGSMIAVVNGIADYFTGLSESDSDVNWSRNVYPGQEHCKHDQGHSIWHEQSANALLDLVFMCDYVNALNLKYNQ